MKPQTGEGLLQRMRDTKDSWQPREAGRGKEGVLPRILGGVWPYYGTEFEAPSLQFDLFWVDRDVSVNLATLSLFFPFPFTCHCYHPLCRIGSQYSVFVYSVISHHLRQLVICVNSTVPRAAPKAGQHDSRVCLRGEFWKRLALVLADRASRIAATEAGGRHSICWGLNRMTRWREGTFAVHWSWDIDPSRPWTSLFLILGPLHLVQDLHHRPSWFSGLQSLSPVGSTLIRTGMDSSLRNTAMNTELWAFKAVVGRPSRAG